ncbi:DUF6248 family natural product biosynthesis protein [Streptomyces sp. NPDC094468]|uniref:DUF6248 family natural product biosynthesis protein n=1 Tax=Streptomyces sp. NPDC094468 TaxID=3366066 RepID=UPI00382AA5B1
MPTTWLRYVGASIMGILDPRPSSVPSPMSEEEGAWVRAHAWRAALRSIDDAYPHGFHRWCSCEAGTCHACRTGHHDQCISRHAPRVDEHAGTITDRSGFVVAVIRYATGQRPCRWLCPCAHPITSKVTVADGGSGKPAALQQPPSTPERDADSDGQLTLFPGSLHQREDGQTP